MILNHLGAPKMLVRENWCPAIESTYPDTSIVSLMSANLSNDDRANACLTTCIMRLAKMTTDHDLTYEIADVIELLAWLQFYTARGSQCKPKVPSILLELINAMKYLQSTDGGYDLLLMPFLKETLECHEEKEDRTEPSTSK